MVRFTVILAVLFLICVHAAPEPFNTHVTLLKDSSLGYAVAAGKDKKAGVLDGTRTLDFDLPDEAAKKAPEITLLENVNSAAGIALGNIDLNAVKDSILAGKNPFWRRK